MRCIVTGGAGFIGSHLVDKLLAEGHEVIVIDNFFNGREKNLYKSCENPRLLQVYIEDITNASIRPHFKGVDWVFHLAGLADIVPSIERPADYYNTNVTGTFNVMDSCRIYKVKKVIYAASSSCYGIPSQYPTKETAKIKPEYPYALTKYLGEQIVLGLGKTYNIPVVSLRLFNVYGPRMWSSSYGGVFKVFLPQLANGFPLTRVGDGTQERDFVFVSDVISAFYKTALLPSCNGEVINIGGGIHWTVNSLIFELADVGAKIEEIPKRPGEPKITWADITKAWNLLRWKPQVNFHQGVQEMLKHLDEYKNAKLWTKESIEEATEKWFKYLGTSKGV